MEQAAVSRYMEEGCNLGQNGSISEADMCPYGIITTNQKSPIFQGFSVIRQGFSSFSKPKNLAAYDDERNPRL